MQKNHLVAIIVLALVVIGVVLVYLFLPKGSGGAGIFTLPTLATSTPARDDSVGTYQMPPRRTPPQGALEYYNPVYHFALLYPDTLQVKEYKEKGASLTVTFTDPATHYSFQVFVTPYGEDTISKERFMLDEPSGVVASSTTITIGGKSAAAFYGKDAKLGDTREVWVINHGFLIEVTTYAELDEWLSQILGTWELW